MEQIQKYIELNQRIASIWHAETDDETKLLSITDEKLKRAILLDNVIQHLTNLFQFGNELAVEVDPVTNKPKKTFIMDEGKMLMTSIQLIEKIIKNTSWKISSGPLVVDNNKIFKIGHTLKGEFDQLPKDRPLCFYSVSFAYDTKTEQMIPTFRFCDMSIDKFEIYSEDIEHTNDTNEFKHMESKLDADLSARMQAFEQRFGKGKLLGGK